MHMDTLHTNPDAQHPVEATGQINRIQISIHYQLLLYYSTNNYISTSNKYTMFGESLSCLLLYVAMLHVASTQRTETEKNLLDQWLYISYTVQ